MNYFLIRKKDIANGPGIRTSIWLSGCTRHCEDCFNQEAWEFDSGKELTQQTIDKFVSFGESVMVKGFSILGGEPLQQEYHAMLYLLERLCAVNKPIWLWTGYKFEDLNKSQINIVKHVDVLVDGAFEKDKADPSLKFRGSSNQRIIDIPQTLVNNTICLKKEYM